MAETPLGFSFDQTDDGFVLRNRTGEGITEIKMTADEVQGLKTAIDLWSSRRLLSLRTSTGVVQPIEVHWIANVGVWPDELRNIVLGVEGSSGGEMKLGFSLHVAARLAVLLTEVLEKIVKESPTRQ